MKGSGQESFNLSMCETCAALKSLRPRASDQHQPLTASPKARPFVRPPTWPHRRYSLAELQRCNVALDSGSRGGQGSYRGGRYKRTLRLRIIPEIRISRFGWSWNLLELAILDKISVPVLDTTCPGRLHLRHWCACRIGSDCELVSTVLLDKMFSNGFESQWQRNMNI